MENFLPILRECKKCSREFVVKMRHLFRREDEEKTASRKHNLFCSLKSFHNKVDAEFDEFSKGLNCDCEAQCTLTKAGSESSVGIN